jgi:hypothetical protein
MPREVEIDRFKARSDDGKEYTIIQYQDYIQDRNSDAETPGLKRLTTSEDLHVHIIDEKTFKIFETGEIVRKI